ncbi:MAG: TIR domain-containing protein, partial [Pseudomonadota bacterium]
MTDVFISYARRDSALAERLAETLTALGLNVWWDRRLLPGEDWEMEIERRIDGAKAVIVIWSAESVKSRAVRAEARRADRQSKLAPVCAEPVEPPLFSSGIHYEDLSGWTGDTAAVEFQDLWAQLIALTGGVAEASHVPRDGATAIMAPVAPADGAPILNMPWLNRPLGPFRSAASLLSSLMVIGFSAMMGFYREEFFGPYWEGVFLLAGTALLLFLAGERELKPNVKAMVARWLQPQPKAEPMRASAAFLALFEAVFSKRHLSLRCLWASLLASVGIYAALLLLFVPFDVLEGLVRDLIENGPRAPEAETIIGTTYVTRGFLEQNAALLFIAVPLANIFVDYLSLGQTRMILRWSARGAPLGLAVLLDAALTALIFVALLPLGPVTFVLILEAVQGGAPAVAAALEAGGKAEQTAEAIWRQLEVFVTVGWPGEALSAVAGEANVPTTALLIAFFTTFTTSAWLWFALLFAPLVRLLSWTRRSGLSWLGAAVNTRQRPIAPLGYAAASLFLIGGAAITEVADALSVKVVSEDPPAQTPFRDCADCPEMVMLAGGSFLMGSPPTEVGREPRSFIFEGPQTTVEVAPFAMARFETTFRQWDACVAETADRSDAAER